MSLHVLGCSAINGQFVFVDLEWGEGDWRTVAWQNYNWREDDWRVFAWREAELLGG